jgi:hypothetical protein
VSEHAHDHHETTIHVDRHQFKVEQTSMTGAELRQLPSPAIGGDYDLYREVLKDGMHFFSVQRHITPGS